MPIRRRKEWIVQKYNNTVFLPQLLRETPHIKYKVKTDISDASIFRTPSIIDD